MNHENFEREEAKLMHILPSEYMRPQLHFPHAHYIQPQPSFPPPPHFTRHYPPATEVVTMREPEIHIPTADVRSSLLPPVVADKKKDLRKVHSAVR